MKIIVDGDACPNINDISDIASDYDLEMLVFTDYSHNMNDNYYKVIKCDVGSDSCDLMLIKVVTKGDVVITQDYGLSALCLSKGAVVINPNGLIINDMNIDNLLMSRFSSAKLRKSGVRSKGPSKRTKEVVDKFLDNLIYLINN